MTKKGEAKMRISEGYEGIEISGSDSASEIEAKRAKAELIKAEREVSDLYLMKNEALERGITGATDLRAKMRDRRIEALEARIFELCSIV